ncbi:MAG: type II restriction endonuclease [Sphingomicrobium sp.]
MFEAQAVTERGNRADFLFPGSAEYHDETFPPERLTILAAKSTCKDRWRQVLPEAQRIWSKHLATLEPAISSSQTEQMQAERVQLVIPVTLQSSYRDDQRTWLMSVAEFIALVAHREQRCSA